MTNFYQNLPNFVEDNFGLLFLRHGVDTFAVHCVSEKNVVSNFMRYFINC